jgi:hypothetical protein
MDQREERQDGPVDRPVADINIAFVLQSFEGEVGCG